MRCSKGPTELVLQGRYLIAVRCRSSQLRCISPSRASAGSASSTAGGLLARRRGALDRGHEQRAGVLWLSRRSPASERVWAASRGSRSHWPIGLFVTLLVVWRDADRSDATYIIVSLPRRSRSRRSSPQTYLVVRSRCRGSTEDGRGRLLLQIATYLQKAHCNRAISRCLTRAAGSLSSLHVPPDKLPGQQRCSPATCQASFNARRSRRVTPRVRRSSRCSRNALLAGYLAYTSSGYSSSRACAPSVNRVGVSSPSGSALPCCSADCGYPPPPQTLALLIAIGVARERPDALLEHRDPLGEPAGLLAEPRDDGREVEQDRQEEAEGDDEQRVGRGGDAEGARRGERAGRARPRARQRQPGHEPQQ